MSTDEQHSLASTPTLLPPLTLPLLMLLVLSLQPASSYAHAESSTPQLYVKDGDTFLPLDGRFAVVPLENVLERRPSGGRRRECIAACLRAPSRTGRSLDSYLEASPPTQEQQQQLLDDGPDCIIKTTQVKVHYGQCHIVGGMIPYCISDVRDSTEAPIVDIFSRDCAFSPVRRVNGWAKAASKMESNNPIVFADFETLPELAVAHKRLPSHSASVTSTSDASLPSATTQAEVAAVNEPSTAGRHDAEQT